MQGFSQQAIIAYACWLTDAADAVESACRRRTFCCAVPGVNFHSLSRNFNTILAAKQNVREICGLAVSIWHINAGSSFSKVRRKNL